MTQPSNEPSKRVDSANLQIENQGFFNIYSERSITRVETPVKYQSPASPSPQQPVYLSYVKNRETENENRIVPKGPSERVLQSAVFTQNAVRLDCHSRAQNGCPSKDPVNYQNTIVVNPKGTPSKPSDQVLKRFLHADSVKQSISVERTNELKGLGVSGLELRGSELIQLQRNNSSTVLANKSTERNLQLSNRTVPKLLMTHNFFVQSPGSLPQSEFTQRKGLNYQGNVVVRPRVHAQSEQNHEHSMRFEQKPSHMNQSIYSSRRLVPISPNQITMRSEAVNNTFSSFIGQNKRN